MEIARWIVVVEVAWLVGACGAGSSPGPVVERSDSAGVAIVLSRGADVPLDWTFTPVLRLGGADGGPEAFFGVGRHSVAVGPEGHLYVLDSGNHHVQVFDAEGRHVRTLGRKGGGPGEMQLWPRTIRIGADGTVHVYDIGKRGLVRFAADGTPLPEVRLDVFRGSLESYGLTESGIVAQTLTRSASGDDWFNVIAVLTPAGDTTHLLHSPSPPMKPAEFNCVAISGMTELLAPELRWTVAGERIFVVEDANYVIDVYEAGRFVASYRREVAPLPATRELALRAVGDKMEVRFDFGGSCVIQPDEVVDVRGYAKVVPTIGDLAIAPDGTLWIRRYAIKDEAVPIDILAPDGSYVGTLPAGTPFPDAFFPDGRIVAVERDELEVPRVVVYRVEGWNLGDRVAG